jgi:AcrR family transcriptional regulator
MNASARREKHKKELRAEMLNAAREIFSRDGYEGFTMRKLARSVEYSPANIYLYFKDKDEIFDCLVDASFADLLEVLPQPNDASDEDPVSLLKRSLHTYVNFGLSHPNHYQFAFVLRPAGQVRPHKQRAAYESLLLKVRLCIEKKKFRTADVNLAAQALWASVHGITSLLIQRPVFPWVERDKLIRRVIDSAVDGLLVRNPGGTAKEKTE